jgi:sugar lactone lactonase YvrE
MKTPKCKSTRLYTYMNSRIHLYKILLMAPFLLLLSFVKAQNAVSTHAGSSQGYLDATGTSAKFKAPTGICISPDGQYIYVADYSGHRIRRINITTKAVTTIAGNGTSGYLDSTGVSAKFSYPSGVCISPDGSTLFVCDNGNSRIRRINLSNQRVSTVAGDGNFGYTDHSNGALASFNGPTDVVISGDSVLYVSDTENHLIRKIDLGTSAVSTLTGMANVGGFQNGTGYNAAFRLPKGMAISNDQSTLFIADNGNNMIRKVDLVTRAVSTVAGDGTPGFADAADGLQAKFNTPAGVAVVPGDNNILYVADNSNHRIRKIELNTTTVTTVAGTGAVPPASVYGDNSVGMNAKFFYPTNLIVSPNNSSIYVADQGNFRVRRVMTDLTLVTWNITTASKSYLKIMPNPCKEDLMVTGLENKCRQIQIINSAGAIVKDVRVEDSSDMIHLSLAGFPPGFYILKAYLDSEIRHKKFLIAI